MYINSTWQNAKPGHKLKVETDTIKSSKSIDLNGVIKIKHKFFDTWLTMGHIPREIPRHATSFMEEGRNVTGYQISTTDKVSPIPNGALEVRLLQTFFVKSERIFKLMKSFVNDFYDNDFTGKQAENNEEESGDDEEIDIKLKGEGNATNENNENVIEIDYPFLFQIALGLKKKCFSLITFQNLVSK